MEWIYDTDLSAEDCFERLIKAQHMSAMELNPAIIEVNRISETRLYLVYKGRKYSKMRRTEYIVDFSDDTTSGMRTKVTVTFTKELFRILLPMTPVQDLDYLMNEKLNAHRRM